MVRIQPAAAPGGAGGHDADPVSGCHRYPVRGLTSPAGSSCTLLGPATVALAIPLYQRLPKIRRLWLPVLITLVSGVTIGALSSVALARLFGASLQTQLSLAPKSGNGARGHGYIGTDRRPAVPHGGHGGGDRDPGRDTGDKAVRPATHPGRQCEGHRDGHHRARNRHARAFQVSTEMGAFSGLAMAIVTFTTALVLPWLLQWLGWLWLNRHLSTHERQHALRVGKLVDVAAQTHRVGHDLTAIDWFIWCISTDMLRIRHS